MKISIDFSKNLGNWDSAGALLYIQFLTMSEADPAAPLSQQNLMFYSSVLKF